MLPIYRCNLSRATSLAEFQTCKKGTIINDQSHVIDVESDR